MDEQLDKAAPRLEPCPWCKVAPIKASSKHPVGGPATKQQDWFVILHVEGCIAEAIMTLHVSRITQWNTRAQSAAVEGALKALDRILQCFANGTMPHNDIIQEARAALAAVEGKGDANAQS